MILGTPVLGAPLLFPTIIPPTVPVVGIIVFCVVANDAFVAGVEKYDSC